MSPLEIALTALLRISKGVDHPEMIAQQALDHVKTLPQHLRELHGLTIEKPVHDWHTD